MKGKEEDDFLDPGTGIPIFSFGDMRLMNINIPTHLHDSPDDDVMTLPREVAERSFVNALLCWQVSDTEAEDFKNNSSIFDISRVLQIHQYLRLIFGVDPFDWLHEPNRAFGEASPWEVIFRGDIYQVSTYLDGFVFGGLPPLPHFFAVNQEAKKNVYAS